MTRNKAFLNLPHLVLWSVAWISFFQNVVVVVSGQQEQEQQKTNEMQQCAVDGSCDASSLYLETPTTQKDSKNCIHWLEMGLCSKNIGFMMANCPLTCEGARKRGATGSDSAMTQEDQLGSIIQAAAAAKEVYNQQQENFLGKTSQAYRSPICVDLLPRCATWAKLGECERNPDQMDEFCAKACGTGVCDKTCVNEDERCSFWARSGECNVNPSYMHYHCAKACNTCKTLKQFLKKQEQLQERRKEELISEDSRMLIKKTGSFGKIQRVQGAETKQTMKVVRESVQYMETEISDIPSHIMKKCQNRQDLCAFWASIGECENNEAFMTTNCAPSCKSCHLIDMGIRCPPLPDLEPALRPGDLNRMFERIVREAPGNKTLTNEESQHLRDAGIPEYTVSVVSGPGISGSSSSLSSKEQDRKQPPWIITFDNFLSARECEALIELGYKEGYARSKDVGEQKFDGSFDGKTSSGRTSQNAWCSHKNGCRQNQTVQNVMTRMSGVLGIPSNHSEDLQLLRYETGQFYESHHDYIPFQQKRQCGPRILTFFLYLSDVERGGETMFDNLEHTIVPKQGRALLWPSVMNSSPADKDPRTTHAALPVEAGKKYAANGWIHLYEYLGPQKRGCN